MTPENNYQKKGRAERKCTPDSKKILQISRVMPFGKRVESGVTYRTNRTEKRVKGQENSNKILGCEFKMGSKI